MNEERPAKYTDGHHESVLRGHQRRTAEDFRGLPAAPPGAGIVRAGHRVRARDITPDLAALVAPGAVLAVDQFADVLNVARGPGRLAGDPGR